MAAHKKELPDQTTGHFKNDSKNMMALYRQLGLESYGTIHVHPGNFSLDTIFCSYKLDTLY